MHNSPELVIPYDEHDRVRDLRMRLTEYAESISIGFDRWDEDRILGPGLYLAIVVGPSLTSYADGMGENRWPDDAPRDHFQDPDGFFDALETTAYTRDGALVIAADGVVVPQLVRFRSAGSSDEYTYADWMGARHMSALDVSTREDVIATITLSQESGRVTVFEEGLYTSIERERIGGPWLAEQ